MTDFYVKNGGNDAADGLSDATAWATVGHALSVLSGTTAGHRLLGKCGSVFDTPNGINFSWGGDISQHAIIDSYYMDGGVETVGVSGVRPIGKGDFFGYWTPAATVSVGDYVAPQKGAETPYWYKVITAGVLGATPPAWPAAAGATVIDNGVVMQASAISGSYLSSGAITTSSSDSLNYREVNNWRFENQRGQGLDYQSPTGLFFRMNNVRMHMLGSRALFTKGNGYESTADWDIEFDSMYIEECSQRSHALNSGPASVSLRSHNTKLKNSIIYNTWRETIFEACHGCEATDNILCGAFTPFYILSAHNLYLARNIILGSTEPEQQRFSGYVAAGFWFNVEKESTAGTPPRSIYSVICENNIIAFCWAALKIGGAPNNDLSSFKDSYFRGNTCVDNYQQIEANANALNTGSFVINNIFANYTTTSGLPYNGPTSQPIVFDYNCWWPSAPVAAASGGHDLVADPKLYKTTGWQLISHYSDISANDARIYSGSPVIGAGTAVAGFSLDIAGNARANPPSIGAWEVAIDPPSGGPTSDIPLDYPEDIRVASYSAGTRQHPRPLNTATGDWVFLVLTTSGSSASSGSNFSGLDQFEIEGSYREAGTGSPEIVLCKRKIVDINTEPAQYNITSSIAFCAITIRVTGADTEDPVGQVNQAYSSSSVNTLANTGFNTSGNNSLLLNIIALRVNDPTVTPAAMDPLWAFGTGSRSTGGGSVLQAAQGATGTKVFSWTTNCAALGVLVEILAGESSVDIAPPLNDVIAHVSSKGPDSFTLSFTLTDDTPSNIRADAVATKTSRLRPTVAQVFAHTDGDGIGADAFASKSTIASGVSNTLTLSGLTEPKCNWSFAAVDNATSPNYQVSPVTGTVLLDPPENIKYTEVTINEGAAPNSVLFSLSYQIGDVIVYPTGTNEGDFDITIDGAGLITINRAGSTDPQTFEAYLWSQSTGAAQPILFQDPFYQAQLGRFRNNTDSLITNETVYVFKAIAGQDLVLNCDDPSSHPLAIPVVVDGAGYGVIYDTVPGEYNLFAVDRNGAPVSISYSRITIQ
ncbi:MAG: hypothetical protein AB7I42_25620 [Bradyrhizobium sp.]|uniref:hypothetical protein n=1 Tax=Bradyrhizobium sp. TaxID=376 RepID=UPI003D14119A